jgi:hypothetical protein
MDNNYVYLYFFRMFHPNFLFFFFFFFFFFFSFGVLQLMLPEAPQPYGLLYYSRIGPPTFSTSSALPRPPKQRKLEL